MTRNIFRVNQSTFRAEMFAYHANNVGNGFSSSCQAAAAVLDQERTKPVAGLYLYVVIRRFRSVEIPNSVVVSRMRNG